MSRKCFIDSSFWTDPWVMDYLTRDERTFFIYLITGEHANVAGIFEASLRTLAHEADFTVDEVRTILERISEKVMYVDGWIVLRNAIKHQNYHSPKMKVAIERVLAKVPQDLLQYVNMPTDWKAVVVPKPTQEQLILEDGGISDVINDDQNARKPRGKNAKTPEKSVVIDDNSGVPDLTTLNRSKIPYTYRMGNSNSNSNSNPAVPAVNGTAQKPTKSSQQKTPSAGTAEAATTTTGSKNLNGNNYAETDALYAELLAQRLVNPKFKSWYCSVFYRLKRERVLRLASEAKADGKDPERLFSELLKRDSGSLPVQNGVTASLGEMFGGGYGSRAVT